MSLLRLKKRIIIRMSVVAIFNEWLDWWKFFWWCYKFFVWELILPSNGWEETRVYIYPLSCSLLRVFLFKMNQFDYMSVLDWHISRYVRSFSNINQKIFLLKRKFSIFKLILGNSETEYWCFVLIIKTIGIKSFSTFLKGG